MQNSKKRTFAQSNASKLKQDEEILFKETKNNEELDDYDYGTMTREDVTLDANLEAEVDEQIIDDDEMADKEDASDPDDAEDLDDRLDEDYRQNVELDHYEEVGIDDQDYQRMGQD